MGDVGGVRGRVQDVRGAWVGRGWGVIGVFGGVCWVHVGRKERASVAPL